MRTLACMTLACSLLLACNGDGNMATTQASKTTDPSGEPATDTGDGSASSTGGTTEAPGTTQDPGTTDAVETATGNPTTGGPTTDPTPGTTETATDATTDATTGADTSLMTQYGAPCTTDDDCIDVLGAGGICLKDILGVYSLPGGYCSTACSLPDQQQTYIPMAADCKLGADCVGLMGFFEGCSLPCTDNSQCPRAGYECRTMPEISNPGDPSYCLMTEDNKI